MGADDRPNIILITTDTQGWEMVSAYRRLSAVETPHIDALAANGVLFENAFTAGPPCTPARSAWYTGMPPNRNGAMCNETAVSRGVPFLAEILGERGYRCRHIGKFHLDAAGYNGSGKCDGGFEAEGWYDLKNFLDEVGTDGPNRFGGWNKGLHDIEYCFAHRVADRAIDSLRTFGGGDDPFFLAVEFDEPHGPYICPPPYRGKYAATDVPVPETLGADLSGKPRLQQEYAAWIAEQTRNPATPLAYYHRYFDCNAYVDYEFGRVLKAAEAYAGDNLVIIFTSDHGDHRGAFGLAPKGPTMYDHTIRVPFIVAGPIVADPGRRVSGLTSGTDLFATVLDLCGAPSGGAAAASVSSGYTGVSLLPVLIGASRETGREAAFIEYNRFGVKFEQFRGFYPIRCVRTERWKLSINLFDTDELYDLAEDPGEARNLIDDPSAARIRDELHDQLLVSMTESQDILRGPGWYERSWRAASPHRFTGLLTTGAADNWEDGKWEI